MDSTIGTCNPFEKFTLAYTQPSEVERQAEGSGRQNEASSCPYWGTIGLRQFALELAGQWREKNATKEAERHLAAEKFRYQEAC